MEFLNDNYISPPSTSVNSSDNSGYEDSFESEESCTSGGCFWCMAPGSDCTSNCKSKSSGCGVLFVQRCEVSCRL